MALSQELKEAVKEEIKNMDETEGLQLRFTKMIENCMDNMCSEAEIADVIELVQLTGEVYEN